MTDKPAKKQRMDHAAGTSASGSTNTAKPLKSILKPFKKIPQPPDWANSDDTEVDEPEWNSASNSSESLVTPITPAESEGGKDIGGEATANTNQTRTIWTTTKPQSKGKIVVKAPKAADEYDSAEGDSEDDDGSTGDEDGEDNDDNDNNATGDSFSDADAEDSSDDGLDDLLISQYGSPPPNKKRKRNDPTIFSNSMSKILSSHLTTKSRSDPVLIRSKQSATNLDESKLESKARRIIQLQKKAELEKGRVKDVIPKGEDADAVKRAIEREKMLKKIAQRGVVRLFNAVRAAQVKAEEAQKEVRQKGVVGMGNREKEVTEMSKQGFLELIQTSSTKK